MSLAYHTNDNIFIIIILRHVYAFIHTVIAYESSRRIGVTETIVCAIAQNVSAQTNKMYKCIVCICCI